MAGDRHRYVVNVADLLRRPSSRKDVAVEVAAHDLTVVDSEVPDGSAVNAAFELESLTDGIVVVGRVQAPWAGHCRRCLTGVVGQLDVAVRELYQVEPETEDAFSLDGDQLDLEPVVREALLLELPLAPLCRSDCAGLCPRCGANRNEGLCRCAVAPADGRWGALDELKQQLGGDEA